MASFAVWSLGDFASVILFTRSHFSYLCSQFFDLIPRHCNSDMDPTHETLNSALIEQMIAQQLANLNVHPNSTPRVNPMVPSHMLVDFTNPFWVHHNENPGAVLVTKLLSEQNYHQRSCSMKMCLKSKKKLGFINGTLLKPEPDDPMFTVWDRCNNIVWEDNLGNLNRKAPTILESKS